MSNRPPVLRDATNAEMDREAERQRIVAALGRGVCGDVDLFAHGREYDLNIGLTLEVDPGDSLTAAVRTALEELLANLKGAI